MKKQLLAVMLCSALLTGCGTAAVPVEKGSGIVGSAEERPVVHQIDLDDFTFGGSASLALAGNLAAAKAGDVSYETASDKTEFTGSSEEAWQCLLDGKLDVALAYAPSAETATQLKEQGIEWLEIGTDALVFLAGSSPENETVLDLTKEDILAAYQENGSESWIGYASAPNSDSRRIFATIFGQECTGVTVKSGEDTLTAACPHTEGTLCYATYLSLVKNGKPENTQMIAVDGILPNSTVVSASDENISDRTETAEEQYPLQVPYYIAVRPDMEADHPAMQFYRWLASDEGKAWLADAVVPVVQEEQTDMPEAS
ncbi:MAG: hypothetical protein LUE11_11290 [Clostridia bacterium]|nr:hypothetical protein [Clostridia bacterium]